MLTVSVDISIQGRQGQPLSVHLWAHCNPLIAHDMNDMWNVDHTTKETFPTLFKQKCGFFYIPFDLTDEGQISCEMQ